jgi:hypothetical protein
MKQMKARYALAASVSLSLLVGQAAREPVRSR